MNTGDDLVGRARARGAEALLARQRPEGTWRGTHDAGPLFTGAALGLEHALGVLRPADAAAGVRYLRAVQRADGSAEAWPFAGRGGHEATCFWYAGMHAAGVPDDDPAVVRARRYIDAHGGLGENLLIVRAFLAAAGALDPPTLPRMPVEHTLIPGHEAFLGRFFGVNALVPLHVVPPIVRGLRDGGGSRGWLRRLADARVVEYLSARQDASGSLAGVPFYTLLMALALRLSGVPADDARIVRAVAYNRATYASDERGLFVGVFHCENWDTAHAVRVLGPDAGGSIRRGLDWLLAAQSRVPSPEDWQMPRPGAPRVGGWSWQAGNTLNPDIDSTAVVLSALGAHARIHSDVARAAEIGAAWLLSMQNQDGGFAAFSHGKRSPPPGPLYLPKARARGLAWLAGARDRLEHWLAEHGDPSTADVTGRVLHGLGALGYRIGDTRIDRAVAFLARHQTESGAWWGRWAINYLPATSYIVTGLCAVGVSSDARLVRRAVAWMLSRQNPDGGFGEHPDSFVSPELAGVGESSVQVTSMVLWALAEAGAGAGTPWGAARAARWLLERQLTDGGWNDDACYGVIFPHRYYYHSDSFPTPLALEALRAWQAVKRDFPKT
jgi:squalene-hopene/tetraprenyl-beta-curcumene cyclase